MNKIDRDFVIVLLLIGVALGLLCYYLPVVYVVVIFVGGAFSLLWLAVELIRGAP